MTIQSYKIFLGLLFGANLEICFELFFCTSIVCPSPYTRQSDKARNPSPLLHTIDARDDDDDEGEEEEEEEEGET